jgi:hypothetical protein
LLGGYEDDTGGNPQGAKHIAGAGVSGSFALTPARSLSWSVGVQQGSYDAVDPFFAKKRSDKRFDASLEVIQRLGSSKQWSLRPQLTWTRQSSNLAPYDFERWEGNITVRRDF